MARKMNLAMVIVAIMTVLVGAGSVWADLTDGLIAHWKLDGNANDSVGSNDGTLVNWPVWTSGQVGGALDFDGDGECVDLGDIDEFEFADNDFSITAWFYTKGTHNYNDDNAYHYFTGEIISKYNWANNGRQWRLEQNESGHINFYTSPDGTTHEDLLSLNAGYQNQWVHVAAVKSGSTKTLYINGQIDNTGTTAGVVTGKHSKVYIGCIESPETGLYHFFNGMIDDVRVYDRALSAEEVEQLYQASSAELVSLEIEGPGEVAGNFGAQYKAIAHYDNNSTRDVTDSADWSVEPNDIASITDGLLMGVLG